VWKTTGTAGKVLKHLVMVSECQVIFPLNFFSLFLTEFAVKPS